MPGGGVTGLQPRVRWVNELTGKAAEAACEYPQGFVIASARRVRSNPVISGLLRLARLAMTARPRPACYRMAGRGQ